MRIVQASVSFQVQHSLQRQQQLRPVAGDGEQKRARAVSVVPQTAAATPEHHPPGSPLSAPLDPHWAHIKRIIEAYIRRHISTVADAAQDRQLAPEKAKGAAAQAAVLRLEGGEPGRQDAGTASAQQAGQRVQLSLREREHSSLSLSAGLELADGRQLALNFAQHMRRDLSLERELSAEQAQAFIDPLVLNFAAPLQLRQARTDFDLDADGQAEAIASLGAGSAYLALDRNGNGRIDDGSELFGALSGRGFAELALFDQDGNGFIDAGDSVFSQLQLFRPSDKHLSSLAERQVAAIALESVSTPFTLSSREGEVLGRVRDSGFYLRENSRGEISVGSVQQIDLRV